MGDSDHRNVDQVDTSIEINGRDEMNLAEFPITLLTDRGLMGEGCIDLKRIRGWVEDAGFNGSIEIEVFSEEHWSEDQDRYVAKIRDAYLRYV